MTVYPFEIDSDADIIRVDDNITEIGGEAINQLREAVFAIERELGIRPSGSVGSVAERLGVSLNTDGTIKSSALTSVGLATLPISDNQVGMTAGIKEYKLALDHSTSDLNTLISTNSALLNSLTAFANETNSDLNTHIAGGSLLTDGSPARHVSSHIDINATPSDSRDPTFTWSGLFDKDGVARTASNVTEALDQINTDLTGHQNETASAHVATAVDIDTSDFQEIPQTIDTVQKLADHIDDFEVITIADHRATQHANGIPQIGRAYACSLSDGYGQNIVPNTPVSTFLVRSPNITPVDDISVGDDVISFQPIDNSDFSFDSQFSQVKIGDSIRINYGSGYEVSFKVESIRYTPGSEWIVRINGTNLVDSDDALARIDRPTFDRDTSGILAVAAANATPTGSFDTLLQSVIVGHPRGAVALGNGFDPGQLDASNYNLYLELYPSGDPTDRVISMPAIDVTGNLGTTPGQYTLDSVVHETNKKLREIGYNFRFIAFADHGNFGIMLADAINCASFSITSGALVSGSLAVGSFTNNVIGDAAGTGFDALGLGNTHADLASPSYGGVFTDATAAQLPTKVIVPYKSRDYIVDGQRRDTFAPTWMATEDSNGDYYWDGYISDRTVVGAFTVETTYTVLMDLKAAGLKPGKTIVIQPTVEFTDGSYFDVDYGRFIIKSVTFPPVCPGETGSTQITVISGIHAAGAGVAFSSLPTLNVKLYFSADSVSFNDDNVIESAPSAVDYHRLHEIFINGSGETFSHERGRMPVQNETGSLLRTDVWHIENISPKLRGYRDNSTTFNKYLRFYIVSFDTDTGEYDGYIGQRDPSSNAILSLGPLTTGRKNVPTRFYDETYVDYIDLVFMDESATLAASINILSDGGSGGGGTPRYVDIELFDSLQLDDNILLLATAEVNWDPVSGQEVIQRVVNRREFGSIDEEDFTESAIDFITAGDRNLHDNGIIRGFEFDFVSPSDGREVYYKGGVAFVNGKILTTNAISVTIPEISEDTAGLPDTIDWAVCVNEQGFLEPILITSTKQQFWAIENTSGSTYYVPSVTFTELVETRKDLVPIDVVNVTISSFGINGNSDVRRFIYDGKKRELVYSPEDFVGTFHSAEALVNWVNQYASSAPLVAKMRGEFNVSETQDFTGLTSKLIIEGDGAVVDVTADKGITVSSNLSLRNITFNYGPDTSAMGFTTDDVVNSANGCIFGTGNISDIEIEKCVFNSNITATTQRPPFISFEINKEDVVQNVNVSGNRFNDTGTTGGQAAISILSLNDAVGLTEPAIVYNVRIEDNVCDNLQGIYIIQEAVHQALIDQSVAGPGISIYDTIINKNNCGAIGYTGVFAPGAGYRTSALTICKNTCFMIATMANMNHALCATTGTFAIQDYHLDVPYPAGSVDIHNNNCSCIFVGVTDHYVTENAYARTSIESNRVTATNPTFLDNWVGSWGSAANNYQWVGIYVAFGDATSDMGDIIIANNVVTSGLVNSATYLYQYGIIASTQCNITGNIVRGLTDYGSGGIGIYAASGTSSLKQYIISNNQIYREGRNIQRYIRLEAAAGRAGGLCVDNYFDDYTLDGSDDEVINGTGSSPASSYADTWVVERNKNQTVKALMSPADGTHAVGSGGGAGAAGGTTSIGKNSYIESGTDFTWSTGAGISFFWLEDQATTMIFQWTIPARICLPLGVEILSISADFDSSDPDNLDLAYILISNLTTSDEETTGSADPAPGITLTLSKPWPITPATVFRNTVTDPIVITVMWRANKSGVGIEWCEVQNLYITYRWS